MGTGDGLIYLALATAFLALAVNFLALRSQALRRWGMILSAVSLVSTLLVWATLTKHFLDVDLSIEYVHAHTSADVPEAYRISGVWAGKVGSFLLWVVGMQAGLLVSSLMLRRRATRSSGRERREMFGLLGSTDIIGGIMTIIFLGALLMVEPFRSTSGLDLSQFPEGRGMNVLLQHPLMAVHPFLALLGYGVATVPFVASVAFLITGNRHWAAYSLPFSRTFFLMFSVALTLGGMWAYTTLGWGGYWAWDPVETSSLLPWLLAGVMCHTQVTHVKRRSSALLGATVSYFLLPVILFATFSARSGLWQSVHAYAATEGDFWSVVVSSGFLLGLFTVTVILSLLGPVLVARAYMNYHEGPSGDREVGLSRLLTNRSKAMLFGNVVVLIGLLIIIFIMMNRVGGPLDPSEFELKLAPLALVLAGGMMVYHFGTRRAKGLPYIVLAIGISMGLVTAGLVPDRPLTAFSLPFLSVGVLGVVYYIWRSPEPAKRRRRVHNLGASMIHLGLLLMLMGYAGSTFLAHEEHVTLSENTPVVFEDYELVLVHKDEGDGHMHLEIEVWQDGKVIAEARPGMQQVQDQYRSEVSVVRLLDKDLYFVFDKEVETGMGLRAEVEVKSLPAINLLWGGAFMVMVGTGLRFVPYDTLESTGTRPLRPVPSDHEEE